MQIFRREFVQKHELTWSHGQHRWIEQRLAYRIGKCGKIVLFCGSREPTNLRSAALPEKRCLAGILQRNCRGLRRWSEKENFSVPVPVIIVFQETWFLPSGPYNFQLSNYTLYRHDEVDGKRSHGGVALYAKVTYIL